jgi:arsenate reductase
VHQGFDDPPSICSGMTDENEILAVYRRVRDEIRDFVHSLPGSLK